MALRPFEDRDDEDARQLLLRHVNRLDPWALAYRSQRLAFWLALSFALNLAQSAMLLWLALTR